MLFPDDPPWVFIVTYALLFISCVVLSLLIGQRRAFTYFTAVYALGLAFIAVAGI